MKECLCLNTGDGFGELEGVKRQTPPRSMTAYSVQVLNVPAAPVNLSIIVRSESEKKNVRQATLGKVLPALNNRPPRSKLVRALTLVLTYPRHKPDRE